MTLHGQPGPDFEWSTSIHFGRRLFECLEWHWATSGINRRRARGAAFNVAAALADVEPETIRKLAYLPSKRVENHKPRSAPRTGLDLALQLDGADAEHLREHGHALAAMVAAELRMLTTTIGPKAFRDRLGRARNEAAAQRLDLPPWLQPSNELPTDSAG